MKKEDWDNPTAGDTRRDTLYSGFVRYEEELVSLPATRYAGLGHAERFPDYWELFVSIPARWARCSRSTRCGRKTTQLDVGLQYARGRWRPGFPPMPAWSNYILFSYVRA